MRLPAATAIALEPSSPTSHARIQTAARELETQFAQMLIKSMRSSSPGDPLLGDNTTYREMYDQQLARELSKGRGLGLAPMIVRQLERSTQPSTTADPTTSAAPSLHLPGAPASAAPIRLSAPVNALPLHAAPAAIPQTLQLAPSSAGVSMSAVDLPALSVTASAAELAAASSGCAPDTPLNCSSPEAFVQSIWPYAQKTAAELGVPAKALVAQAALETGWGRRLVGREGVTSHNLFGIKAGGRWNGQRMRAPTHEFVDGVRHSERADFRAYGSAADSFADYARLLGGARYANARDAGDDTHRFASALQKAGYATDPAYAAKITAIANGPTLNRALSAMSGAMAIASNATATSNTSTNRRG